MTTAKDKSRLRRWGTFFGFVVVGAAAFLGLMSTRKAPRKRPPTELGKPVRVLEVAELAVVPTATGYGVVNAKTEWEMVAQVGGRVIELNPDLAEGRILKKGTLLLRIDPADYKLAASQKAATVDSISAQIAQLSAQEKGARASLAIEEASLVLAERDVARKRKLVQSGVATQTDLDSAQRGLLLQKKAVQGYRNVLRELPSQRRVLRAQSKERRAGVQGARLDVSRTEIRAPYDVRIRKLNVEKSEIVSPNQVLAVADSIDVAEVPAQLTLGALQPLFRSSALKTGQAPLAADIMTSTLQGSGVTATVYISSGDVKGRWEAKLERFSNVDPATRTLGVVVSVDEPFRKSKPGKRPPLLNGMYVEVVLRGPTREGCKAVPRSAIHGSRVHVANSEARLELREVVIAFRQATFVCIESGLAPGERVVLTDLVPAVDGMLLAPHLDDAAAGRLAAKVKGNGQ